MKIKYFLFLLLLFCGISLPSLSGSMVFPFSAVPSEFTLIYVASLSFVFLLTAIILHRSEKHKGYWPIFFAFFIASLAIFFDFLVNINSDTTNSLLLDMLISTLIIVGTIIVMTWISGGTLASIYIKKGNLKVGMTIGLLGFFFFALTSLFVAETLFQAQNLTIDKIIAWLPWILPIVLLNGFREEVLYRGLFLRKYETKLGPNVSNLLQAMIFSFSHSVAGLGLGSYTPYIMILVFFTFILGLVWGYLVQRTDSIFGSVLFHAGSDIPIFIGIFSSLPLFSL
jgi:membrane protease YdiL (CAAX protease family)